MNLKEKKAEQENKHILNLVHEVVYTTMSKCIRDTSSETKVMTKCGKHSRTVFEHPKTFDDINLHTQLTKEIIDNTIKSSIEQKIKG